MVQAEVRAEVSHLRTPVAVAPYPPYHFFFFATLRLLCTLSIRLPIWRIIVDVIRDLFVWEIEHFWVVHNFEDQLVGFVVSICGAT